MFVTFYVFGSPLNKFIMFCASFSNFAKLVVHVFKISPVREYSHETTGCVFVAQSQSGEVGAPSLIDMGPTSQSGTGESFADFSAFQGSKSVSVDDFDPRGAGSIQGKMAAL